MARSKVFSTMYGRSKGNEIELEKKETNQNQKKKQSLEAKRRNSKTKTSKGYWSAIKVKRIEAPMNREKTLPRH
ncbi:unnamed protein product [Prunus armeniaca]|uniref:Uncharacterized protein n=1 Tax=Prunus armeniaca TaxID=36596 RepID=A0A6J5UH27_PRUAR|nr:unnamed protein product [Prunus armeniaca]